MFLKITPKTIGLNALNAKLLATAPRILEQNRVMVTAMLQEIKPIVIANTPLGPGHFGYHLRDSFITDVTSEGTTATGVLKSPRTGYWREFGTLGRFRKSGPAARLRSYTAAVGAFGEGGEKAYMTAHHAATTAKRLITQFYGGRFGWWRK